MSNETMNLINQARLQVKRENLKNFFYKNKKIIKTLAIIALVTVVALLVLNAFHKSRQVKFSEILHQSLINQQIGDIAKAKENLKTIYDAKFAPSGVRSLASLRYAALLFDEGKKTQAAEIYVEINSCSSCDSYIKDLSGLLAVKTWLSDEEEVKKEDLIARIEKIENNSKTLKYYVSEQKALLEMQKNNLEKAHKIFDLIAKNPESSQSLKSRANDHLKMIIEKGFEPKIIQKAAPKIEEKAVKKIEEKTGEKSQVKKTTK